MNYGTQKSQPYRSLHLFETDVLTGFQFYDVYRQKARYAPEERLAFAILTDAVQCFQTYYDAKSRKGRLLFKNAEGWVMNGDVRYPFSFVNICQTLNIAPAYLRAGLIQWLAKQQGPCSKRKRIRETLRYQNRVAQSQVGH